MVMIDQPHQAESASIVLVAQSNAGQQSQSAANDSHVIGECMVVRVGGQGEGTRILNPVIATELFWRGQYAKEIDWQAAEVRVIQQPQHGEVSLIDALDSLDILPMKNARYIPAYGYTGNDSLILKVTGPDYSLEIHYFLRVLDQEGFSGKEIFDNPDCKAEE